MCRDLSLQFVITYRDVTSEMPDVSQLLQNQQLASALQNKTELVRNGLRLKYQVCERITVSKSAGLTTNRCSHPFDSSTLITVSMCVYPSRRGGEKIILSYYVGDIICAMDSAQVHERSFIHLFIHDMEEDAKRVICD